MRKILFLLLVVPLLTYATAQSLTLTEEALAHTNAYYSYAATGPNAFDCSGFVYYCVKEVYGIELKRTAKEQGYDETYDKIEEIENLIEGDLLYFNTNRGDSDLCDHAGIYLGDGQSIHCSSAKGKVIISSLLEGYYNERFSWGRRIKEE